MLQPNDFVGRAPLAGGFQTPYARIMAVPDFMPDGWSAELLRWVASRRHLFAGGPGVTDYQSGYHLEDPEEHYPRILELAEAMRPRINEGREVCELTDLDLADVELELWLSCRGEGQAFHWHTDRDVVPGEKPFQSRALAFCYYMHTNPLAFMGGELEFHDGTTVAPADNLLALFDPDQIHRVRHVHGVPQGGGPGLEWPEVKPLRWADHRWNVSGWVHRLSPA